MESISNITGVAHKAIFGSGVTGGEEPVAGAQGAGTPNSPYDKGNEETDKPSNAVSSDETGDPSSAQQGPTGSDKNQGANSATEEPSSDSKLGSKDGEGNIKMPRSDEERERLMEKGEFPRDPNDHSGEPIHMHSEDGEEKPKDRKDSVGQEGGDPHEGPKKGTGEQYVKSSGLAADGGDFDATKPGAGTEANRLLEQQGVHKDKGSDPADKDSSDNSKGAPPPAKESKLQKIKDKLHIS